MDRNFLKKIPLFAELTDDDLDELAITLHRVTVEPNKPIFWMDELSDRLFIIQSGQVLISYTDEKGEDIVLSRLKPGDFFGELSLIDGGPHTATARALTETVLLTLDRPSFYLFMEKHPLICRALLTVLSRRLRANTIKMRGIININEQLEENKSPFQQLIDRLARVVTSSTFFSLCTLFILIWIAVQIYLFKKGRHEEISFLDKPPTFFLLGFIFTLTSFLLTVLILSSQRRQVERDRIRGEIEYQVNLKSQADVMKLKLKMDKVIRLLNQLSGKDSLEEEEETLL
jgi:CRP/FNR family transcriptional regulator, cyclic AMP receptor protein